MCNCVRVQSYTWKNLPGLLFGMLSLIAGILSLYLPETKKVPLAQTIDEGEKLAANVVIGDLWSVKALMEAGFSQYRPTIPRTLH